MAIILEDKEWRRIEKEIKILHNSYVAIGIHEGEDGEENGLSLALIAAVNEFGTDKAGPNRNIVIPSRAWMRNWFDSNKNKILQIMRKLYGKVLDGKINANTALKLLGEWAQGELRKSITNFTTPPNAPSTIRKKKSSSPLIDNGHMRAAVKYKIFYKKGSGFKG